MYDVEANKLKQTYNHPLAVLDCCLTDSGRAFSGGLDTTLKTFDFNHQRETVIGKHEKAIRCVHYCPTSNLIITGSWDKFIKLWDTRSPTCVGSYEQPDKVRFQNLLFNKILFIFKIIFLTQN